MPREVQEQIPQSTEVASDLDEQEEPAFLNTLRPRTMSEYIGQYELVENLRVAITAARKRNEPLEHVLFHGPPGLGKTTLAHIISAEMDANIHTTSGPALERPGDLMGILTNLEVGDVLFIDEIHRLSRTVEGVPLFGNGGFCRQLRCRQGHLCQDNTGAP